MHMFVLLACNLLGVGAVTSAFCERNIQLPYDRFGTDATCCMLSTALIKHYRRQSYYSHNLPILFSLCCPLSVRAIYCFHSASPFPAAATLPAWPRHPPGAPRLCAESVSPVIPGLPVGLLSQIWTGRFWPASQIWSSKPVKYPEALQDASL